MSDTGADRLCVEFARRVECDLHEPDKLLCHIAWARRILDDRAWMRGLGGAGAVAFTTTRGDEHA